MDAVEATEVFQEATQLNREDSLLDGCLLRFPDYGQLVMTGDLHGHRRNFDKLQHFCDLRLAGARHVVLHEILHQDVISLEDRDDSYFVLLDAAKWKCEYPDQIHFIQSNHELAQIFRHEITKNGRIVTVDFDESVAAAYGTKADSVLEAVYAFIRSYALAGRTANRVFLSHSLPGPRELPAFDPAFLGRAVTDEDLTERGCGHMLVWGRYQTAETLDHLGKLLDVDFFMCGHQPQEQGYEVLHDRMIILASEHNHGVFLPFDLAKPVTIAGLEKHIRPFAGVA